MSKKFDAQLMKFEITNEKLKMEITLDDLELLLKNTPENFREITVKQDKRQEFAEYIINRLMSESSHNVSNKKWEQIFEDAFENILNGAKYDICDYPNEK